MKNGKEHMQIEDSKALFYLSVQAAQRNAPAEFLKALQLGHHHTPPGRTHRNHSVHVQDNPRPGLGQIRVEKLLERGALAKIDHSLQRNDPAFRSPWAFHDGCSKIK